MLFRIPAGVKYRLLVAAAVAALAAGCASTSALHRGDEAERRQDYDVAVAEYTKAVRLKPDDPEARARLNRAKIRAASDHFQRGRRLAATGKYEQALIELELAAELNPTALDIDDELRATRNKLRTRVAVSREGKTELQTLIERARDLPAPGLDLPDTRMPASLVFRDAGSRDVFLAIARFANVSISFDPVFRDVPVTIDLRGATLASALEAVADTTRTFYRVTAPRTILIVPDTPAKRREYEEEVVRTFYLSNADLKETMDLLRMVLDARRISPTTATNALTVKDSPERVAAAARVISAIDKARPEVIIDVELMEVDRTKLQDYGLQIASPGSPGLNGSVTIAGRPSTDSSSTTISLQGLKNLTDADILFTNLPGLYYRLLKTDTNTRILANPQLRTSEGLPAQARFGERVPVPVTTFAPIATGGVAQQPITSFNYENIGVNIDITPRTHHDDAVTLVLKVTVQAISGAGFGGLPTFANREISTTIRLKDGETNMFAGLIRDDERRQLDGIPGVSDIPVLGRLFGHSHTENDQTDILLTITPHIVRILDLNETDLRAFRVGRDLSGGVGDLPTALDLPRPIENQPAPQAPPAPGAPPQPTTPAPGTPPPTTPPPNAPATPIQPPAQPGVR